VTESRWQGNPIQVDKRHWHDNEDFIEPAFVSGYTMYDILSEADKAFVRSTRFEYAAHPYVWTSKAKSRSDEIPLCDLPSVDESKIQILPMIRRNPVTGRLAVQIHLGRQEATFR